ncbi:hypothetical protein ACFQJC_05065 [Haloferax namakaokahaiae]|uniref:Uncharacterized protein n=1 Tax=Haloferax namakaokahaiae TaxID=1748331 RepID=A0ABD5ZCG1_9EURY
MTRKTITVTETAFNAADEERRDGESWSDYLVRTATDTEHEPNTVAVENVDEIARRSAEMVEDRMTRR